MSPGPGIVRGPTKEAHIWIVTQTGFVSIVRHRDQPSTLLVRARDRESLRAFCARAAVKEDTISELADADYRYRVECGDVELVRYVESSVQDLDYGNFKDRVTQTRGQRWHEVLLTVWRTLLRLDDSVPR
jgi:hypothetical protein